jgi:hypothetical protein
VESKIISALDTVKQYKGRYFSLETKEGEQFWEKAAKLGLAPQLNDKIKRASGVYRHWPKCRGIYAIGVDDSQTANNSHSLFLSTFSSKRHESQHSPYTMRKLAATGQ